MARFFSKHTRTHRGKSQIGRRPYLVAVSACLLVAGLWLHQGRSPANSLSNETGTEGKSVDAAATASAATQSLRHMSAAQTAAATAQATKVGTVALAAAQTVASPNPKVETAISEARGLIHSQPSQVIAARDKLNGILSMSMSADQRQAAKVQLSELADQWLFSSTVWAGDALCEMYLVKPGETLDIIGRRCKVPSEALMQINSIRQPRSLQAGQQIKVIHGPFNATVCRSTYTLDLYLQDMFVRSFKVALGAPGSETPTGLWRVKEGGKLIQPGWYDKKTNRNYKPTDPDYPLGPRWIELDGLDGQAKGRTGFAIHGTKDPDQIGTAVSQGCIRMYNKDVLLTYDLMFPLASKVEISD